MVCPPERGIVLEAAVDMVNYISQTCATISTVTVYTCTYIIEYIVNLLYHKTLF